MSNIDTRSAFFPRPKSAQAEGAKGGSKVGESSVSKQDRATDLTNKTASDAKVTIPEGVKDFSKIKKAALSAPEPDNSEKISRLKSQIQAGTYEVNYDALADKILESEF